MKKDTLCWGCANYAKCSWSKGVPVENWKAEKTIIGNSTSIVESYCVLDCPQYQAEKKQQTSVKEIASLIGKSPRTVFRLLERKGTTQGLRKKLREKGFILYICSDIVNDEGDTMRTYYLEKAGL